MRGVRQYARLDSPFALVTLWKSSNALDWIQLVDLRGARVLTTRVGQYIRLDPPFTLVNFAEAEQYVKLDSSR